MLANGFRAVTDTLTDFVFGILVDFNQLDDAGTTCFDLISWPNVASRRSDMNHQVNGRTNSDHR